MARILLIPLAGIALLPACIDATPYTDTHYACDGGLSCPLDQRCVSGLCIDPPTAVDDKLLQFPAGPFYMGCDATMPSCQPDAQPKHLVTLSAFRIQRFEVTAGEFKRCTDPGCATASLPDSSDSLPAHGLNWIQANAFCQFAHGRLPTEAEWERAAHTGDGAYPWGNDFDCTRVTSEGCPQATDEAPSEPQPPNARGDTLDGMHDMAGNVREWVLDSYDASYYSTLLVPRDPQRILDKPTMPGGQHVIRGGGYAEAKDDHIEDPVTDAMPNAPLVVWFREAGVPQQPGDADAAKDSDLGVRCVLPVP